MQAILLATGEGDSLHPLSDTLPSAMLPLVNRPAMSYAVELLSRCRVGEALVSLHRLGGSIEAYFGDGARWGLRLSYLLQREPLGTAGALKWAAGRLSETFLVLPAGAILDLDIEAALAFHRDHAAGATFVVARGDGAPTRPLRSDSQSGRVIGRDLAGEQALSFTGACILEPSLLERIPARTPFDIYEGLLPALLSAGAPAHAYIMAGYWNPLESFGQYQAAQRVFLRSAFSPDSQPRIRFPHIDGDRYAPGIWVGRNHAIHPSVRLAPPVCLGDDCRIGRAVDLGPDAVIGDNVILDDEATVQESTILSDTYVGRLVNVRGAVVRKTLLVDAQSGESLPVVDRHLLAASDAAAVSAGPGRLLDVLAALLLLLLSLPLTVIAALLSLVASRGRLLRRTPRIGRAPADAGETTAPREFETLEFQTRRSDGTVGALGRLLERLEWDHLPSLWNVLRGDLRLVGVKPLGRAEAARVREEWERSRYAWPAGLTGLWYLKGRDANLDETLIADVYWGATQSRRENLKLLWQTPAAWWKRIGRSR
jgi:NDP-sugar pyrophosphorylase family protein